MAQTRLAGQGLLQVLLGTSEEVGKVQHLWGLGTCNHLGLSLKKPLKCLVPPYPIAVGWGRHT